MTVTISRLPAWMQPRAKEAGIWVKIPWFQKREVGRVSSALAGWGLHPRRRVDASKISEKR